MSRRFPFRDSTTTGMAPISMSSRIPLPIQHQQRRYAPRLEGFRFLIRDKGKSRISFRKKDGSFRSKEKDGKGCLVRNREEDFRKEDAIKKEADRNAIRKEGIRTEEGCQEEGRLSFCEEDVCEEIAIRRENFEEEGGISLFRRGKENGKKGNDK